MLRGEIERLTSAGLFEGWAVDDASALRALGVTVSDASGRPVAAGHAHQFQRDEGGRRGSDWAAFRLRAHAPAARLRGGRFGLAASERGQIIASPRVPIWVEQAEPGLDSLNAVAADDPTMFADMGALAGCGATLAAFVASRGVDAFARAAHLYVLGRPIEARVFEALREGMNAGRIAPFGVLQALAASPEYLASPRAFAAPGSDGFPFASR